MNEENVRLAAEIASELANAYRPATGYEIVFCRVFDALTENPCPSNSATVSAYSTRSAIERLLDATGGAQGVVELKRTDPEFLRKLCQLFRVDVDLSVGNP